MKRHFEEVEKKHNFFFIINFRYTVPSEIKNVLFFKSGKKTISNDN